MKLKRIKLSRDRFAIIDSGDYESLVKFKWYCNHYGYAVRERYFGMVGGKRKRGCVWMHREITSAPSGIFVDHKNGNKLDNRRSNLRLATNQQNKANESPKRSNTSGFKGVVWCKKRKRWVAQITFWGKCLNLGGYKNKKEAALRYDEAAIRFFGLFAKTNFAHAS